MIPSNLNLPMVQYPYEPQTPIIPSQIPQEMIIETPETHTPASSASSGQAVSFEQKPQSFEAKLSQLNNEIVNIQKKYADIDRMSADVQGRAKSDQLMTLHNLKVEEKIKLVVLNVPKGKQRFISMALPGKLLAGATFGHATKNQNAINSILTNGVMVDPSSASRYADSELGPGLYFSKDMGYAGEDYTKALVVKTTQEIPTIRVEYRTGLLNKSLYKPLELTEKDIQEGLEDLAKTHSIIQREGMPPRDQEFVVLNPSHAFTPVHTMTWNEEQFKWNQTNQISITENPNLHAQWKPVTPVPVSTAASISTNLALSASATSASTAATGFIDLDKFRRTKSGLFMDLQSLKELLFIPIEKDHVKFEAEVGASSLGNHVLHSLIPAVKKAKFEGKLGVVKEINMFKPLDGTLVKHKYPGLLFDIYDLTPSQMEQLFAHSLVDWVISNTDVFPKNFGIDKNGDVMAVSKGQAFKYFNGSKVQSAGSQKGIESKLNRESPEFGQLDEDPTIHVHALLRSKLKNKFITINFDAPIIQQAIARIMNLTKEEINGYFGDYAKLAFPSQEQAFLDSVLHRCQGIARVVGTFKYSITPYGT
jgi:hypothetical protein